jgi:SHS2 domain-containing protein
MDPRDFEVLEHPADIGFRAFGGTLPELFARSALAMLSIAADPAAAVGMGEPRDPLRHRARLIVKAATYHQLKIERRSGLWVAEVYLDI